MILTALYVTIAQPSGMTAGTQSRQPLPPQPGAAMAYDYEYERNGVSNLFMLFATLEGWRQVEVTDRRITVKGGETPRGDFRVSGRPSGGVIHARILYLDLCKKSVRPPAGGGGGGYRGVLV